MRTPGDDRELVLGLLHGERVIRATQDVASFSIRRAADDIETAEVALRPDLDLGDVAARARALLGTSACGLCGRVAIDRLDAVAARTADAGPRNPLSWPASVITELPRRLRDQQTVFGATGGLHAAAWVDEHGALMMVREDVGRHNAVDKLVGASLDAGVLPATRRLLLVTGRVAYEIVQKAAVAGAAGIVAVGAPTSLAVEAAVESGVTLVGFARDGRCNVYAGHDRIRA